MSFRKLIFSCLLTICAATPSIAQIYWGSGSRDLYPHNATGNRAYLLASNLSPYWPAWPYPTLAAHYVYVENGETIAAAFSARAVASNNGSIRLTSPNGTVINFNIPNTGTNRQGRIATRAQELAGPVGTANSGYIPYTYEINGAAGREPGIWKVEFITSRGENYGESDPTSTVVSADANIIPVIAATGTWETNETVERAFIAAWDVSVRKTADNGSLPSHYIPGRTWTNVLSLSGTHTYTTGTTYYGENHVLTKDGFAYRVKHIGTQGVGFTFFANNKGFRQSVVLPDPNTIPKTYYHKTYQSLNRSPPLVGEIHDPRSLDYVANPIDPNDTDDITHKIFYSKPNLALPAFANVWQGGQTRQLWIKNIRETPSLTDFDFTGIEGTPGEAGLKGGKISFMSNVDGLYKITIPFPPGSGYASKQLVGSAVEGLNEVVWDGTDGNGNRVLSGTTISDAETQLFGAEVHFPFIDMEVNPQGFVIEYLDENFNPYPLSANGSEFSDLVYWDDRNITSSAPPSNPRYNGNEFVAGFPGSGNGIRSNPSGSAGSAANGHKFGIYDATATNHFGDNKSLDTWSYVPGAKSSQSFAPIEIIATDLRVDRITKTSGNAVISVGDALTYEVDIHNAGPDETKLNRPATFFFYVPQGLTINPNQVAFVNADPLNPAVIHLSSQVFESVSNTLSPIAVYKVELDMPVGSGGTFTIPVTATAGTPTRYVNAWAAIMRPRDISDPNGTNLDLEIDVPRDPFEEANKIVIGPNIVHTPLTIVNLNGDVDNDPNFNWLNQSIANPTANANQDWFTNNIRYNHETLMYADVWVTKTVTPASGHSISGQVTFSITAGNASDGNGEGSTATNVRVNDLLNSRYSYVSHTAPPGTSYNHSTGIWNIGILAKDASTAPLQIVATINASGTTQINTATVTANEFDPNLSNNEDNAVTDAPVLIDLGITKTAVRDGNTATFTIKVTNFENSDVNNLVVTDQLSNRYNLLSHAAPPGTSVTYSHPSWATRAGLITWNIGYLAAGESVTLTFNSNRQGGSGSYDNIASFTHDQIGSDPNPGSGNVRRNTHTATGPNTSTGSDVSINKLINGVKVAEVKIGDVVQFTLQVSKPSATGTATTVEVTDVLPPGFEYIVNATYPTTVPSGTFDPQTGVWSNISLTATGANITRTLTFHAVVKAPTGNSGEHLNFSYITGSSRPDSDLSNNTSFAEAVIQSTDIGITKVVNNATPTIGNTVTFMLTIINHGPSAGTGIVIEDVIPNGYTDISNISGGGTFTAGKITWAGLSLLNSASQQLTYQAKVLAPGIGVNHTNTAVVASLQQQDTNPANDSDSETVYPRPSLLITNPMIRQRVPGED